jgi:hypothetical protein
VAEGSSSYEGFTLFVLCRAPTFDGPGLAAHVQAGLVAVKINTSNSASDIGYALTCLYQSHFSYLQLCIFV